MLAGGPPADFIAALAYPLPGEVVFRFIGFPESDDQQLKDWCANRLSFSWGRPTPDEQVDIAEKMLAYWRYVRAFVAHKRDQPGDDLASELIGYHLDHPDDLSYREVESIMYGLSFAGHEPVTLLLGNAPAVAAPPPRRVAGGVCDEPALIPKALEEVVRWNSPQIGWRRITTCDTTLGGVDLPAGTPIYLNLGAANHDPRAFADADEFDLHRPDSAKNISFGKGNHYCLGAKFARFEARVVLEALVERIPTLALADDQTARTVPEHQLPRPEPRQRHLGVEPPWESSSWPRRSRTSRRCSSPSCPGRTRAAGRPRSRAIARSPGAPASSTPTPTSCSTPIGS